MATSLKADAHHEPAILPFDWSDPYDLEHQLTEEERLVRVGRLMEGLRPAL